VERTDMERKRAGRTVALALLAASAWPTPAGSSPGNGPIAHLPGTLDPQNFLARIARGELPAARLYEDDRVIAVLADRPSAPGHFMVWLTHSDARDLLEVAPDDLAHIMLVTQRIARATVQALGAEGITVRQNNGSASNVHQFHVHVIPRWPGDRLPDSPPAAVPLESLAKTAARIRAAMTR